MNTRLTLKTVVIAGLTAVLVSLTSLDVQVPVQAAPVLTGIKQTVTPTVVPTIYHYILTVGGDCSADRATGDLYLDPDGYCMASDGAAQQPVVKKNENHQTTTNNGGGSTGGSQPSQPANQCKNKNSGKDGTPSECNAGKGQEKKS